MSKNDENRTSTKDEELCIQNEELCIIYEEFWIQNEELCIIYEEFWIKNEELCIIYEEFWIKNDEFCRPEPPRKYTQFCIYIYHGRFSIDSTETHAFDMEFVRPVWFF